MTAARGTVLIVVAGSAAILAALAVAFLVRMRSDGEDGAQFGSEIATRVMLTAGLEYVAECARIGWGAESFGWRDIRTGLAGPCDRMGRQLFVGDKTTGVGPAFPAVGGVARCPMRRMRQPPFALAPDLTPNPIELDPTRSWAELVNHLRATPIAAVADYASFRDGDRRPAPESGEGAWFRVLREDIDTFLITAGAGGTLGFASYDEAVLAGGADAFGSREAFDQLRAREILMHIRARWSPAVAGNAHMHFQAKDLWQLNPISSPVLPVQVDDDQPNSRQLTGSFSYTMRLMTPPTAW